MLAAPAPLRPLAGAPLFATAPPLPSGAPPAPKAPPQSPHQPHQPHQQLPPPPPAFRSAADDFITVSLRCDIFGFYLFFIFILLIFFFTMFLNRVSSKPSKFKARTESNQYLYFYEILRSYLFLISIKTKFSFKVFM